MCLCGNLGLLKESGQYSTLAPMIHHQNQSQMAENPITCFQVLDWVSTQSVLCNHMYTSPPLLYHQSEPSVGLWLFLANPMSVLHPEFSAIFHAHIPSSVFLSSDAIMHRVVLLQPACFQYLLLC